MVLLAQLHLGLPYRPAVAAVAAVAAAGVAPQPLQALGCKQCGEIANSLAQWILHRLWEPALRHLTAASASPTVPTRAAFAAACRCRLPQLFEGNKHRGNMDSKCEYVAGLVWFFLHNVVVLLEQ